MLIRTDSQSSVSSNTQSDDAGSAQGQKQQPTEHHSLSARSNASSSSVHPRRNADLPPLPTMGILQTIKAKVAEIVDRVLHELGFKPFSPMANSEKAAKVMQGMKDIGSQLNLPADASDTQRLLALIKFTPELETHHRRDRDSQLDGLELAHSMMKGLRPKTADAATEFGHAMAKATAGIVGQVSSQKHSHSLMTEAREANNEQARLALKSNDATYMDPVAVGFNLAKRLASDDKASSKAMEMLGTALSFISPGKMDAELATQVTDLLQTLPKSKHAKQLRANFDAIATAEQRGHLAWLDMSRESRAATDDRTGKVEAAVDLALANSGRSSAQRLLERGFKHDKADDSASRMGRVTDVFVSLSNALGMDKGTPGSDILAGFLKTIPDLSTHKNAGKDNQLKAITVAHALFKEASWSPSEKNQLAKAALDIVSQVDTKSHSHSLGAELKANAKQLLSPAFNHSLANHAGSLGVLGLGGAAYVAGKSALMTAKRMASDDKASSKAMELALATLKSIPAGQMENAVANKVLDLLENQPKGEHLKQLRDTFLEKASVEQQGKAGVQQTVSEMLATLKQ